MILTYTGYDASDRRADSVLLQPLGVTFRSDITNSPHHAVALIRANSIAASEGPSPTMPTKLGGGVGISR